MDEGGRRRLQDREIVEILIKHDSLSLPQIAKLLDANVGSVDYHLKKLAEKGIVKIKKKKYGTKYSLNYELVTVSIGAAVQFTFVFIFTLIGFFFLLKFEFVPAALSFSISSIIGTFFAVEKLRYELRGKLDRLLEELE